jgi:structural maintenance of chromosomes flexible hinge domain-containing protein 1
MFSFVCNCSTNDLLYRVGSTFPSLAIACYDIHDNRAPFKKIPDDVTVELQAAKDLYFKVHGTKTRLSFDKMTLKIMVCIVCTSSVLLIEK